ncbi:hypothetical protein GW17_00061852 [Ensete ventricosum]|uniref:Uncharacterized protein n=1 Tax=Ensete ventricosum TaxID=4639 RepID=A0A444BUN0_ENSVE|nr:hypothetical protein GW17_00061852 [Ensete ventricosum]RZR74364.1 hypothetical protein BHM03_00035897 [Ensete ventricosum]
MLYGHKPAKHHFMPHGRYKPTVKPLRCLTVLCSPIQLEHPSRKRTGYMTQIRNLTRKSQARKKTYFEEREITLKITGGTMKCKSNSLEPDLIDEEWDDEDVH